MSEISRTPDWINAFLPSIESLSTMTVSFPNLTAMSEEDDKESAAPVLMGDISAWYGRPHRRCPAGIVQHVEEEGEESLYDCAPSPPQPAAYPHPLIPTEGDGEDSVYNDISSIVSDPHNNNNNNSNHNYNNNSLGILSSPSERILLEKEIIPIETENTTKNTTHPFIPPREKEAVPLPNKNNYNSNNNTIRHNNINHNNNSNKVKEEAPPPRPVTARRRSSSSTRLSSLKADKGIEAAVVHQQQPKRRLSRSPTHRSRSLPSRTPTHTLLKEEGRRQRPPVETNMVVYNLTESTSCKGNTLHSGGGGNRQASHKAKSTLPQRANNSNHKGKPLPRKEENTTRKNGNQKTTTDRDVKTGSSVKEEETVKTSKVFFKKNK